MKIRAVTLDRVGGPLRVQSLDLADPRTGEVLVRMRASGVCHSDQHVITGRHAAETPCVLGHEGAGEVIAIGPGVHRVAVGDRVALNWLPTCKQCFYCDRDQHHLCRRITATVWSGVMADGTSRISRDGEPILHYSGVSTWATHMVVPQECCQVLRPAVPFDVAAIIGCAVATGVGAALHRGNVGPGHEVAVVGAGGVGLSVIMGSAMAGADRIIAVDREPAKEELARELGATDFLVADEHAVDRVRELTEGRGADVVFEAVGDSRLQERWLDGVRPGGTLVLVGLPGTDDRTSIASADLARTAKTITGSYFAAIDPGRAIDQLSAAYLDGRLPIHRLISKRVGIDDVQDAIDAMLSGSVGRSVIVHGDGR